MKTQDVVVYHGNSQRAIISGLWKNYFRIVFLLLRTKTSFTA
jgi:hypothetical protein